MAQGLKGKHLGKEERKLEFCIVAKTCSGKAKSRDEAEPICKESLSKPKPPKVKAKRGEGQTCENEALELTQCILNYFEVNDLYKKVLNINSAGSAIASAILECKC